MQRQPQDSIEHWARSMEARMEGQRDALRNRDPFYVAQNSGADWEPADSGGGVLSLALLQTPLAVQVPGYRVLTAGGDDAPTMIQALVTAYLLAADGTPRAGDWIAFRELPQGLFYHQAFTGYSGGLLARALGDDLDAFKRGARAAGGRTLIGFGDAAYEFQALPRIWLAVVYWLGDDEDGFPPQANVLFDRSANRYLIVDGLAILGGQLARRIVSAARR